MEAAEHQDMTYTEAPQVPPFCPNPGCRFHRNSKDSWRFIRFGFFSKTTSPQRVQRLRCVACRRTFSTQTFSVTYWLKKPELLSPLFHRLVGCAGYRQIAREFEISPQTVLTHAARLGRHCLLFHEFHRPKTPRERHFVLDSFESFEYSQFHPTGFHLLAGQTSHFLHGFTESEKRRSGTMTDAQKRKRTSLEEKFGRPDVRSTEREVEHLLRIVLPKGSEIELHSDEHQAYPRALRRVPDRLIAHRTISSRAARNPRNPLFPINLLDLLIRHSGANHKRETIAFSKRRQSAIERLWIFTVWRNCMKSFSERKRDGSPAMRLGLFSHRLKLGEILKERLFASRIQLPERWRLYYERTIPTRMIPGGVVHRLKYAF